MLYTINCTATCRAGGRAGCCYRCISVKSLSQLTPKDRESIEQSPDLDLLLTTDFEGSDCSTFCRQKALATQPFDQQVGV